ncbi:hypothetical protein HMPREF2534_04070 [Bacteroides thetaiotaomicron]|jgi:hypothetical protein|nr:hypothetical protein HMPREF2534_04070 [Bacteroides thetaiotaomicron]
MITRARYLLQQYIQVKRIKLAKEHMVDIEEVVFYVLSSPFLAEL